MDKQKNNPAPPEIKVERDKITSCYGNTEIVITVDGITIQAQCTNHQDSVQVGD